jgi:uncharacterized protein
MSDAGAPRDNRWGPQGRVAGATVRRVLSFPPVRIVLGIAAFAVLLVPVQVLSGRVSAMSLAGAALEFYAGIAAIAALAVLGRWVERRPLSEVGLPVGRALMGVPAGLLIGSAIAAVAVGLLTLTGSYVYSGAGDLANSPSNLALLVTFELGSAVVQAVLFFGIVFRILLEWLGRWPSIALSVVLFGLLHLTGPEATAWTGVVVGLSGGALLALAFVLTRAVWLPMGVLWGVNVTVGEFLGGISGSHASLVRARIVGPDLWTGGASGVEGSAAILIPAALTIAVLAWRVRTREAARLHDQPQPER